MFRLPSMRNYNIFTGPQISVQYAVWQTGPILCKDENRVDIDSSNVVGGQIDAMDTSDVWACDSRIMKATAVTEHTNDCVGKSEK